MKQAPINLTFLAPAMTPVVGAINATSSGSLGSGSLSLVSGSCNTPWINLQYYNDVSMMAIVGGTLAGTIQLRASDDPGLPSAWRPADGQLASQVLNGVVRPDTVQTVGSGSNYYVEWPSFCGKHLRAEFTYTSGTGSLYFAAMGKQI